MSGRPSTFDASDGELVVSTGVTGRAARLGHRLTIAVNTWHAGVEWDGDRPVAVDFTADVDSLGVLRGDGGVTPLSAPEKVIARSNALRSLDARHFPRITFHAKLIKPSDNGFQLGGTLEIRGKANDCAVDLYVADLDDSWTLGCEVVVRQSDFGIKPFALMMGAISVADEVTVALSARRAKDR